MTPTIATACIIVAVILFLLSAVPQIEPHHSRLQSIGLAFFAAAHWPA